MATPSLFPLFMKASQAGAVIGGDIEVLLMANPDIELEPDLSVEINDTPISVETETDIIIEVED